MGKEYINRGNISSQVSKEVLYSVLKEYKEGSNIERIYRMVIMRMSGKSFTYIGHHEKISPTRASEIINKINLRLKLKMEEK